MYSRYDGDDDRGRSSMSNAPQSFQQRVIETLMRVLFITASIIVLAILVFVGIGIWKIWPFVWDHLWILGVFAVGVVAYLLILALAAPTVAVYRWVKGKGVVHEVGQFGGYLEDRNGKFLPMAPLTAIAPKQAVRVNTAIDGVIPTLGELLADNRLFEGENALVGFRADKTPRYEPKLRGTVAIGGKGETGKSVTAVTQIIIALLSGEWVTVCDPHKTKPRSLYRKLEPLAPWIEFAFSDDAILKVSEGYLAELLARKNGAVPYARKIVYDEFKSIVKHSPQIAKTVTSVCERSSDEGMGYEQGCLVICHAFTEDAIGSVAIRNAFKHALVHNMDSDQSKYVLRERKFFSRTGSLKPGHVFYRDDVDEIEYLIEPFGTVEDAKMAAALLEQMGIPKMAQRMAAQLAPRSAQKYIDRSGMEDIPEKKVADTENEVIYAGPHASHDESYYRSQTERFDPLQVEGTVVGSVPNVEHQQNGGNVVVSSVRESSVNVPTDAGQPVKSGEYSNIRTFPKTGESNGDEPVERLEREEKEYRLSESEIHQFVGAYKACGSIKKALQIVGRGARYHQHAVEILEQAGIRQNTVVEEERA